MSAEPAGGLVIAVAWTAVAVAVGVVLGAALAHRGRRRGRWPGGRR